MSIMTEHEIDIIFLVSPTTSTERMAKIAKHAKGFIYYVSLKGVTGRANIDVVEVAEKLAILRECTDLPLGVGFGIRNGSSAAAVSEVADAVVVGSSLVNCIADNASKPEDLPAAVANVLAEMRHAINARDMAK